MPRAERSCKPGCYASRQRIYHIFIDSVSYSDKTGGDQVRKQALAVLTKHGASRPHALQLIKLFEELSAVVICLGQDLAERAESYDARINEDDNDK